MTDADIVEVSWVSPRLDGSWLVQRVADPGGRRALAERGARALPDGVQCGRSRISPRRRRPRMIGSRRLAPRCSTSNGDTAWSTAPNDRLPCTCAPVRRPAARPAARWAPGLHLSETSTPALPPDGPRKPESEVEIPTRPHARPAWGPAERETHREDQARTRARSRSARRATERARSPRGRARRDPEALTRPRRHRARGPADPRARRAAHYRTGRRPAERGPR